MFSPIELLRFIALHLITAPPNYKWQEFLEYCLPARGSTSAHAYTSIPLAERDEEGGIEKDRDSNVGDDEEDLEEGGGRKKQRGKLNLRNTAIKWFIDCITLGKASLSLSQSTL